MTITQKTTETGTAICSLADYKKAMMENDVNDNIIEFDVFRKCFTSGRDDWRGRAYALLGYIKSYLFWEELLINRTLLDSGKAGGYYFKYEMMLATNDQEQCQTKCLYYLIR